MVLLSRRTAMARKSYKPEEIVAKLRRVDVGLAAFSWRGIGSFGGRFFELSRACEVEGGMAPDGIVEPVDVAANGVVGFLAGVEDGPPDELGFQGLKERLHHGVVVAISLAGHRDQDAVLAELGLIVDRAILAATIRMVDQPCCRTAHGQGFAQSGKPGRDAAGRLLPSRRPGVRTGR